MIRFLTQTTSSLSLAISLLASSVVIFYSLTNVTPSLAFIRRKQNGSELLQNDDFVVPIICYKVEDYKQVIAIFRDFMV